MKSASSHDRLEKTSKAAMFFRAAIGHVEEVEALASLDDAQLLSVVCKSLKVSQRTKAADIALQAALTFRRIATLLAPQDSEKMLLSARKKAHKVRDDLVARKEVISSGEFTDILQISRQALSKAVKANRIFSVEVGGENYYPAFFADPAIDRRKLERVSKLLGELSGWQKWQFFTNPKASLENLTPLEALKKGHYERVATAVLGFAER